MKKPILILIGGGSAAGKSTLPKEINKLFDSGISIVSTDDFVKKSIFENAPLGREESEFYYEHNWYLPSTLDTSLLLKKLKELLERKDIYAEKDQPEFEDDIDGTWVLKKSLIKSTPIIVVEGVHALQNEELNKMADLKIYSHTDDDKRLILKIRRSPWFKRSIGEKIRDFRDFGSGDNRLAHAFKCWWESTTKSEKEHVLPTKKYADLILDYNESEELEKNTNQVTNLINLYFENEPQFRQKVTELRAETKNQELVPREKVKELENKLAERERERVYWWLGGATILLLALILIFIRKKKMIK